MYIYIDRYRYTYRYSYRYTVPTARVVSGLPTVKSIRAIAHFKVSSLLLSSIELSGTKALHGTWPHTLPHVITDAFVKVHNY